MTTTSRYCHLKKTGFIWVLTFFLTSFSSPSVAQYDDTWQSEQELRLTPLSDISWLEAGMGVVGSQLGYQASLNFQIKSHFMTSVGYDQALDIGSNSSTTMEAQSISFEMGYVLRGTNFNAHLTTGPSYSWGQFSNQNDSQLSEVYDQWGLKFKAGVFTGKFPLGISSFVHFNTRNTYAGITLNLVLKWKKR